MCVTSFSQKMTKYFYSMISLQKFFSHFSMNYIILRSFKFFENFESNFAHMYTFHICILHVCVIQIFHKMIQFPSFLQFLNTQLFCDSQKIFNTLNFSDTWMENFQDLEIFCYFFFKTFFCLTCFTFMCSTSFSQKMTKFFIN